MDIILCNRFLTLLISGSGSPSDFVSTCVDSNLLSPIFLSWLSGSIVSQSNLVLTAPSCDTSGATSSLGGGSGTAIDPYRICSVAHWMKIAEDSSLWSKSFALYADLDFSSYSGTSFRQIGTSSLPFTGTLNGRGYTLKNLNMIWSTSIYATLFGWVQDASFQNVTVQSFTLQGTNASALIGNVAGTQTQLSGITLSQVTLTASSNAAGLVVATGNSSTLTASQITISNLSAVTTGGGNVAGIVGTVGVLQASNLRISSFSVTRGSGSTNLGGVAGRVRRSFQVSSSTVEVNSSTASGNGLFGGVVADYQNASGSTQSNSISNVRVSGDIFWVNYGGGLVGEHGTGSETDNLTIQQSSWQGRLSTSSDSGGLIYNFFQAGGAILISESSVLTGPLHGALQGAGGLISTVTGASTVAITDSYVNVSTITCAACGGFYNGGLVRQLSTSTSSAISRTYATGAVSTGTTPRCFARTISGGALTSADNYYDSDVCTVGDVTAGVNPLSTGSIQVSTPFANWSSAIWNFQAGAYPRLRWE